MAYPLPKHNHAGIRDDLSVLPAFPEKPGNSYSKYGLAFAVFTVSSAAVSRYLGPRLDRSGREILAFSSLGMMAAMLAFPWIGSYAWVLAVQAWMGVCSAMQRMSERLLLADYTDRGARGPALGTYHFWTSVSSGFAVMAGGYLIDWLTIDVLFYLSAFLYAASAWMVWRLRGGTSRKRAAAE
ncbi:MFS transporter [Paenibacillus sp. 1P03SA]|uniref:MFS transporter n=1 Tax=Paenibacillus sp. 1P03SA TaxID=3132294 RepID=UPI0039A35666